jgi:hypothetical protein
MALCVLANYPVANAPCGDDFSYMKTALDFEQSGKILAESRHMNWPFTCVRFGDSDHTISVDRDARAGEVDWPTETVP